MKKCLVVIISLLLSFFLFLGSFFVPEIVYTAKVNDGASNLPIIIIDAGHGGFDGGAVGNDGIIEKNINLQISLFLQEYLSFFNIKTIMIRESDCSVEDEGLNTIRQRKTSDLHNRMKIMEETDNAIFVSIHQNKYYEEKYSGAQVFYSPKHKEESQILAQSIQDCIVNSLQKDNKRQIKECGSSVYLMNNAAKPAVLVECGFLSNFEESRLLNTSEYQKKIAFCIAMGIQNYITFR